MSRRQIISRALTTTQSQTTQNSLNLRTKTRRSLVSFEEEITNLLVDQYLTDAFASYIMGQPAGRKTYFIANKKDRDKFFFDKGITEYKIVQSFIEYLDSKNAPPQCYNINVWLLALKNDIRELENDKVFSDAGLIVADQALVVARLSDVCTLVYETIVKAHLEGFVEVKQQEISVTQTRQMASIEQGQIQGKNSVMVKVMMPVYVAPFHEPTRKDIQDRLKTKNLNIKLMLDFRFNLFLKEDENSLAQCYGILDNMLNAVTTILNPGLFVKQLRIKRLEMITSVFKRLLTGSNYEKFAKLESSMAAIRNEEYNTVEAPKEKVEPPTAKRANLAKQAMTSEVATKWLAAAGNDPSLFIATSLENGLYFANGTTLYQGANGSWSTMKPMLGDFREFILPRGEGHADYPDEYYQWVREGKTYKKTTVAL